MCINVFAGLVSVASYSLHFVQMHWYIIKLILDLWIRILSCLIICSANTSHMNFHGVKLYCYGANKRLLGNMAVYSCT